MLSNIKWKQIGEPTEFSVKKNTTIPLLTMSKELTGTKRTFLCDATFEGVPVIAQIIAKIDGVEKYKEVKGFMIEDDKGIYVVPFENSKEPNSPLSEVDNVDLVSNETESIKTEIEGVVDVVKSKEVEVEKILGFTYKQLFVITGVAFSVYLIGK